jgi:hypothetical protein
MKKILILLLLALGGYFMYTRLGVHEKLSAIIQPQITILDLQSNPSVFSDSLVELKNLHIIESQSVMNYSKSIVTDNSGRSMLLFSNLPFRKDEIISAIKGRYTILYQVNGKSCEIFISESLKPFNDIMHLIKQSVLR